MQISLQYISKVKRGDNYSETMGLFQICKILFLLFGNCIHSIHYSYQDHVSGGATGLLIVLVSYLLQLDPEPALQLSDLDQELQRWYKRGAMVEILGHEMFTLSEV